MSLPSFSRNEKLILGMVVVVLLLFWAVAGGYIWVKSKKLVSFPPNSAIDHYLVLPSLINNKQEEPEEWIEYISEEHQIAFSYPKWMQLVEYKTEQGETAGWLLFDTSGQRELLDINITISSFQALEQKYPEVSFHPSRGNAFSFPTWEGRYLDLEQYYFLVRENASSILIQGRLDYFELMLDKAEIIIEQIAGSFRRV